MDTDSLVRKEFHSIKKPFTGVRVLLGKNGSQFDLIVFESEVMSLNPGQQEAFMAYLLDTKSRIERLGVVCGIVGEKK